MRALLAAETDFLRSIVLASQILLSIFHSATCAALGTGLIVVRRHNGGNEGTPTRRGSEHSMTIHKIGKIRVSPPALSIIGKRLPPISIWNTPARSSNTERMQEQHLYISRPVCPSCAAARFSLSRNHFECRRHFAAQPSTRLARPQPAPSGPKDR
jgi:hypothetical protein